MEAVIKKKGDSKWHRRQVNTERELAVDEKGFAAFALMEKKR